MRCEDVRVRLDAYTAGEIRPPLAAGIKTHLETCESCGRSLDQLNRLAAVFDQSHTPPTPEGFADRVMAAARERMTRRPDREWNPFQWWRQAPSPMRAAAAVLLVVGLAGGLVMGWTTSPSAIQTLAAQSATQADPLDAYNLDYLGEAPNGSLADSYLALVSGRNGEGR